MKSNHPSLACWRRLLLAACLGISMAALSGCVFMAATGAGAVTYVSGELETKLRSEYDLVVEATRQALADLQFARLSENHDPLKAVMVSRTAQDKKIEVTLEKSGNKLTNIKIRVGIFGDEQVSMSILDKIKARL